MFIAHIAAAVCFHGHRAGQLDAALGHEVKLFFRYFLAGDGGVILGLHRQIALIAAFLAGAESHRPYPVAQGEAVMQRLLDDAELGKPGLGLIHGGVVLGLVQRAFAEALFDDVALQVVGQAGACDVDDGVAHAVAVVNDVGQHADLRRALVAVVALGADQAPEGHGRAVEVVIAHDVMVLLIHKVRALGQGGQAVIFINNAREDIADEGDVAGLALGPVDLGIFFGRQDLFHVAVVHEVIERGAQFAIVIPQAQVVGQDGAVDGGGQLAVALFLKILVSLHDAAVGIVAQAGVGVGGIAAEFFELRQVHGAVATDRTGGAADHLGGVLFCDHAVIEHRFLAAVAHQGGLAGGRLACVDGAAGGRAPGQAGMAGPAGVGAVILAERLRRVGHNVVVVGAHQIAHHIVVEVHHALGVSHGGGAGAVQAHSLQLLGAEDGADAAARAVGDA